MHRFKLVLIFCFSQSGDRVFAKMPLTQEYTANLENKNKIDFDKIVNTAGSYIPSMCYTKTPLINGQQQNPCYVCHIQGAEPNFVNDSYLQQQLDFPVEMRTNPYRNLFVDHTEQVAKMSDKGILKYVRQSNYKQKNQLLLTQELPADWPGYRPDAYYNFDEDGFDRKPDGSFTLWRAFRYYPFPGTFWPTNGSTDDVMIRLAPEFSKHQSGEFDLTLYKVNLAIVESLIKFEDIQLSQAINESKYGEDLNQNGRLDSSQSVVFPPKNYVGMAKKLQQKGLLHLAPGLFPERTEFLHSVRYLDWNTSLNQVSLSARMKELRYAKKYSWFTYSELKNIEQQAFLDIQKSASSVSQLQVFRGTPEKGLRTATGWVFQGFIEAKNGQLRPQTREETLFCMGCHSGIGVTTDATFSFSRKLSEKNTMDSWRHWSQVGMTGIKEPIVSYRNNLNVFEYSFYLQNNPSGSEFSNNSEILERFFDKNGNVKPRQSQLLHQDISRLLFPSYQRALNLNKGYKVIVEEQSYIYGRGGNVGPLKQVHKSVKADQTTGLMDIITH